MRPPAREGGGFLYAREMKPALAGENVCVGPPTPFTLGSIYMRELWINRYLIVIKNGLILVADVVEYEC